MASPFNAQSREEALQQYTQLSSSPNPNDKLLALGGLTQFISEADESYLCQCAKVTDYEFLDRLIRNEVKVHREVEVDRREFTLLACAVLNVFAHMDEVKVQPQVLDRIPALIDAMRKTDAPAAEIGDILDILQNLAHVPAGADKILSPDSVPIILKCMEREGPRLRQYFVVLSTSLKNATTRTDKLRLLQPLAQLFSNTKRSTLVTELINLFTDQFSNAPPPKFLHIPLYHGLRTLLLSKLDESTTANVLILLSLLLNHIGPSFLFNPPPSERNAKQFALIAIRHASAGCQTSISRLSDSSSLQFKRQVVAEMDILHIATAWLLTTEDDVVRIGEEKLSPHEILTIQDSLSSAVSQVSLVLREKYDVVKSSETDVDLKDVVDPVVQTAVKFVGGWIGEGGSSDPDESLGLLEFFFGLCLTEDIEITTWAMRGIKGMVLYTETGTDELLSLRDQYPRLLRIVIRELASSRIPEESVVMIREVCNVFRILVESQPLLVAERCIKTFPGDVYASLSEEKVDEATWSARTEAALLGLEILLKMGDSGDINNGEVRELMRKWLDKVKVLIRLQKNRDVRQDLLSLAAALENMSI